MNKKADKMKNIKDFAHEPTAIFLLKNYFFIKEGCQIGSQWHNANNFYIYANFS